VEIRQIVSTGPRQLEVTVALTVEEWRACADTADASSPVTHDTPARVAERVLRTKLAHPIVLRSGVVV
jgi:hypothetical protein